jgi:hypothetical protein
MEVNNHSIEGSVNTRTSMLAMATRLVCELGIMHLVTGSESYKTTSRVVTHALGRINEIAIKVGDIHYVMICMTVDTNNYDLLFGLDFLIKIGVVVDVEKGTIQVRQRLGNNIQILPFNMVNML